MSLSHESGRRSVWLIFFFGVIMLAVVLADLISYHWPDKKRTNAID